MSAAHELVMRGFEVDVYEWQPKYVGGKARSIDVPDSAAVGNEPFPGEHGFRFFPGFYRHVTATMKEIPIPGEKVKRKRWFGKRQRTAFDNLVPTTTLLMATDQGVDIEMLVEFPSSLRDMIKQFKGVMEFSKLGFEEGEIELFVELLWQFMTSSRIRRDEVYERISWWDYFQAEGKSSAYQQYLVGGIVRTLVAAKPRLMSAKTGGDIFLQLIYLMANPHASADRVLNAPTNDAWLWPWLDFLQSKGVNYYHDVDVKFIHVDTKENPDTPSITKVTVMMDHSDDSKKYKKDIEADYYVVAVPVERMAHLIDKHNEPQPDGSVKNYFIQGDTALGYIPTLAQSVNWMNGAQYYMTEDVTLTHGHTMYPDSPWALTAISQIQFWGDYDMSNKGNGKAKGILSVDISDWFANNTDVENGKPANELTRREILDQTWDQLESRLNGRITKDMITFDYLDRDIIFITSDAADDHQPHLMKLMPDGSMKEINDPVTLKYGDSQVKTRNHEPLLVNTVNSWSLRPEAFTRYQNMFLASDYVRTFTDLATMEGANEAARRATNAILIKSGSRKKKAKIWDLHEPLVLAIWRFVDRQRYLNGMPWNKRLPFFWRIVNIIWVPLALVFRFFSLKE